MFLFSSTFNIANYADDCSPEFSGSINDVIRKLDDYIILIKWNDCNDCSDAFKEGISTLGSAHSFDDKFSASHTELNTNKIFYQCFCRDKIDIEEFERYLEDPSANYGKDKIGIIIFQSNSEQCWIADQADKGISLLKLYFVRTESVHVDPVSPQNQDSDSDHEIAIVVDEIIMLTTTSLKNKIKEASAKILR